MTTSDQNPEEEKPASAEERLEAIKKEENEDASTYYAQGSSGDKGITEKEFNEPIPPMDPEEEEMSLLKAVAFLGFGMAALAIIFILFFIRDLGSKVGDVDAAVHTLETKFGPIKQQMESGFARVDQDVSELKSKVGNYEKMVAVMELKRAKVAIQEVTANSNPDLKAKSGQLISSIDSLLNDLGAGDGSAAPAMAAPAAPAAAPAPAHEPEPAHEPAPAAEPAPEEEAAVEEAPATEEDAPGVIELASEGESAEADESEDSGEEESSGEAEEGGDDEGGDDEEEEEDE